MTDGVKGFLYVIKSKKDDSFYFGSTKDVNRRLAEHNRGNSASTKNKIPWELWFVLSFSDVREARLIEQKLKRKKQKFTFKSFLLSLSEYID